MKLSKIRLLSLLLALSMLFVMVGCNRDGDNPSSSDASTPSGSDASSGAEEEETLPIDRVFLIEEIDKGIERNADTKGWIYIPNTTINDAVLQGKDNDYYLRLTEDKKYDIFGCYFADFRCNLTGGGRDSLSKNTVIYGHSDYLDTDPSKIGTGKKFSQLFKYTDIDFLRENPYIYFSTPEEDMIWQIFAVFYTNIDFNYIDPNPSVDAYANIISEAKARSEYIIDMPVEDEDYILTLSTCTNKYQPKDNYRFVVMAKLLPTSDITSHTMEVEVNPNPKRS